MEGNQLDRPRYYRRMIVDHRFWDYLFNLPEGFKVEGMVEFPEYSGYQFLVSCPEEEQYKVEVGAPILCVTPTVRVLPDGTRLIYHPDLGQEEPSA